MNRAPPASGPIIRVALFDALSIDMAGPRRPCPTLSPRIVRRTGKSVDQHSPLMKAPSPTCQISSIPNQASTDRTAVTPAIVIMQPIRIRRRSIRSAIAPVKVPNIAIGSIRNTIIRATSTGEAVSA